MQAWRAEAILLWGLVDRLTALLDAADAMSARACVAAALQLPEPAGLHVRIDSRRLRRLCSAVCITDSYLAATSRIDSLSHAVGTFEARSAAAAATEAAWLEGRAAPPSDTTIAAADLRQNAMETVAEVDALRTGAAHAVNAARSELAAAWADAMSARARVAKIQAERDQWRAAAEMSVMPERPLEFERVCLPLSALRCKKFALKFWHVAFYCARNATLGHQAPDTGFC